MEINKVVFDGQTLIDLTNDSVTPDKMFLGTTAHQSDGSTIVGTAEVVVFGETMVLPPGFISNGGN